MNYNYGALDTEGGGLLTRVDQVYEIALVLDNLSVRVDREDLEEYLAKLPKFHCFIKHERIEGHVVAIAMHNRIFNILAKEPVDENYEEWKKSGRPYCIIEPKQVQHFMYAFLKDHNYQFIESKDSKKVVAAGKNLGSYDFQIMQSIPGFEEEYDPRTSPYVRFFKFQHRVIDPSMLYFDVDKDISPPSLDECLKRAEIDKSVTHDAVGDALDIIRTLKLSKKLYS